MTDPTTPDTLAGPAESAALASELFAPGVGAQAGPPTTPASDTGTAGAGPGSHSHGGPVPTGSPAERFTSTDPDDFPVVTGREEDWRFTPMKRVRPLLEGADTGLRPDWDADLPEGVELTTVGADDPLLKGLPEPVDRLAALTRVRAGGATVVRVPADAQLDAPVTLTLRGRGGEDVVWGQTVIEVGRFAKATIVLDHQGEARYSGAVAVVLGDGAQVELVSVQDWAPGTAHGGQYDAVVGRDATFTQVVVTLGGDLVRLVSNVTYTGPVARSTCSASTSPTRRSTRSTGCGSTTRCPTAAATSSTRARCRASRRTPCGWATSASARRPPAPRPTS